MKKHYRNLLITSTLSVSLALSACSSKNASGTEKPVEKETPIQVENITVGNLTVKNEIIAKAVSDSSVDVFPKMIGELVQVNIKKGDKVKKGDILAIIDNSDQRLAVQMEKTSAQNSQSQYEQAVISKKQAETAVSNAKLGVKQAELNLQKAKDGQLTGIDNSGFSVEQAQLSLNDAQINYDRMKTLYDQGAVSKQQLEQAESALSQAEIALEQATLQRNNAEKTTDIDLVEQAVEQAKIGLLNAKQQLELANVSVKQAKVGISANQLRVEQAEMQLDDSKIVATNSGEVTNINAIVGELVTTNTPFTTIVDVNNIKIQAQISANQLPSFQKNQPIKVEIPALSKTVNAKITYISNVANESGFYLLEASIPNKDGMIKPGMVTKVINESAVVKNSLIVPTNAVIEKGEETFIFIVKDGKAVKTPVEITRAQSELTAVKSEGLTEKIEVVTRGQNTLSDGNKVKVIKEEQ